MDAYLDTTIITDLLLKTDQRKINAQKALLKFNATIIHQYAIKEFKAGPLIHYRYIHNLLNDTRSLQKSQARLSKITKFQPRKVSTALEAMSSARLLFDEKIDANIDRIYADSLRSSLEAMIQIAWRNLLRKFTKIIGDLTCYKLAKPEIDKSGNIVLKPTSCFSNCCLLNNYLQRLDTISDLLDVCSEELVSRPTDEIRKRTEILNKIVESESSDLTISNSECRNLGDAVLVFFAPSDSIILTTNIKDFEPLAAAMNKVAQSPAQILGNS